MYLKTKSAFTAFTALRGLLLLVILVGMASGAQDKNVTIISAVSSADGQSTMGARLLEECIEKIPTASSLDAVVTSKPVYLKEINGEKGKNDFVQVYTASMEVNYMLHQKELIIVTTNSINKTEPVMKVVDKKIKQYKLFESDPATGDLYAGRSRRQYYFSDKKSAQADVKKRAAIWLRQQSAVVCKE